MIPIENDTKQQAEKTLFSRIIDKEIPADIVYQNEHVTAFKDINPQAPTHLLIVPNKPVASVSETDDSQIFAHVIGAARDIAKEQNLSNYRLIINNGAGAGQTVFHLHVHLLAGRALDWPPG